MDPSFRGRWRAGGKNTLRTTQGWRTAPPPRCPAASLTLTPRCKMVKLPGLHGGVNRLFGPPMGRRSSSWSVSFYLTRRRHAASPRPAHVASGRRILLPMTRVVRPVCLVAALIWATPLLAQERPLVVRQLDFEGNRAIPDEILAHAIVTTNSSWFARAFLFRWLGLGAKRYFDEQEFRRDVVRLGVLYKRSGYPERSSIRWCGAHPRMCTLRSDPRGCADRADHAQRYRAGFAAAAVAPRRSFRTCRCNRATRSIGSPCRPAPIQYHPAAAGPRLSVGSRFHRLRGRQTEAQDRLGDPRSRYPDGGARSAGSRSSEPSGSTPRWCASSWCPAPARRYSQEELFQSQRNLYESDLFRFATVNIDSAAYHPGDRFGAAAWCR